MSDRVAIHALWGGTVMYGFAIMGWTATAIARHAYGIEADNVESFTMKGLALFGPILSVVSLILSKGKKPETKEK